MSARSDEANIRDAKVKTHGAGRGQKHPMEACVTKVTRNPAEMGKLMKSVLK